MSTIVQSYDASNNAVYPVTHLRAVRDSSGTTLESMMQDVREMAVGYYECSTPGSTAAKIITTDSSVSLSTKILCKVKFVEKNTANNTTMNINGTGAKALYYNGVRAAANNSWYPNEVVDLYYDGTNYQAKSCADTLEYDVSLHQTHEITEITKTTRTLVFNGNVVSSWESETSISDSSVEGYTRSETNTGQDIDSTTVDGPNATYDSSANQTNVVYVTTHTYTHVVNNYTFQEAVNAVPMSYRHGGLKLRFISNSGSSVQSSDNKYMQYFLTKNEWSLSKSDWEKMNLEEEVSQLESKTNKENTISTKKSDVMKGQINPNGSFIYDNLNGWEYVLFLVAPNDKITFKASGYNSNVISYYKIGQTPSKDSYIKGMRSDGNGSTSYKEYVSVAEDFSIAAVCWYRPYGEPFISIERTTSIENLNYIINDYEEKFAENSNKNRMITGDKSLYNIIDKYIGLTGGAGTSENYCSTDFILIDKSNDIIIVNGSTGNSAALICLYDKDKNFIAESSKGGVNSIHIEASKIPEDAVYFRSCTYKTSLDSIVVYNNIGYSFQPFYQKNINRINNLIVNDRLFSTNEEVNTYIKEIYCPSYEKTNNDIWVRVGSVSQSSGKYYNGVMLNNTFMFYDSGYTTVDEAIAAANQYSGILSYNGNYIIIDFTSIKTSFNKKFVAEYYDVTKLFNSPNIKKFLDKKGLKEELSPFIGNSSIKKIEIGKDYTEIDITGKITTKDSGTYKISTKISVAKGDIIKVTGSGYNTLMIAEYKDSSEPTPLSFIGGTRCENRVVKEYEYVCQENGYVLICWASVYAQVTSYTHITGGSIKDIENSEEKISNIIDIHTPLNILIFGDSITDTATIEVDVEDKTAKTTNYKLPYLSNSYTNKDGEVVKFSMWPALLRKAFNTFDIRCYARYGATYVDTAANKVFRQNLSDQIALAFNDLSNPNGVFMTQGNYIPDIVIFALSANDSPTPKDTFEIAMNKTIMSADGNSFDIEATLNNLDITQYNQAVRYAFLKLKNKFPYAQMFCICPPQRSAYDIGEMQKEVDLKRMARRYSINIIDAAATCGIVRDLEINGGVDVYSKDGLHPNDYGQKLYARMVVNAIKNNMIDMTIFD